MQHRRAHGAWEKYSAQRNLGKKPNFPPFARPCQPRAPGLLGETLGIHGNVGDLPLPAFIPYHLQTRLFSLLSVKKAFFFLVNLALIPFAFLFTASRMSQEPECRKANYRTRKELSITFLDTDCLFSNI